MVVAPQRLTDATVVPADSAELSELAALAELADLQEQLASMENGPKPRVDRMTKEDRDELIRKLANS